MEDSDKQNDLKKSHLDNPAPPSKVEIVTNLFSEFSEKEGSKEFDTMKEDLISFVALKEGDLTENQLLSDELIFKSLLYNALEKIFDRSDVYKSKGLSKRKNYEII